MTSKFSIKPTAPSPRSGSNLYITSSLGYQHPLGIPCAGKGSHSLQEIFTLRAFTPCALCLEGPFSLFPPENTWLILQAQLKHQLLQEDFHIPSSASDAPPWHSLNPLLAPWSQVLCGAPVLCESVWEARAVSLTCLQGAHVEWGSASSYLCLVFLQAQGGLRKETYLVAEMGKAPRHLTPCRGDQRD